MADHIPIIYKAPADVFYIELDWADWLAEIGSPTIATSAWTVAPVIAEGVTVDDDSDTDTTTMVRVSTGEMHQYYFATCHIVAYDGQEKDRSVEIRVRRE